ncbi:hypothetical protein TNCV_2526091 [Trichonephila clavipes]|nr:hypothetical protein TNCV_2526091 [Trichonephila clavipes]
MRQARHLPQRWYWSIVLQVRDVIRQFTQGTPNCNTNPKATVFGIPKEPVLESAELITSRLTGAGSLLPPVYGEAWAKGHATGTPDSTFPRYGSPHTANMRCTLLPPTILFHTTLGSRLYMRVLARALSPSSIFIMPKKINSFSQTPSSTPRRHSCGSPIAHRLRSRIATEQAVQQSICKVCHKQFFNQNELWYHLLKKHEHSPRGIEQMNAFPLPFLALARDPSAISFEEYCVSLRAFMRLRKEMDRKSTASSGIAQITRSCESSPTSIGPMAGCLKRSESFPNLSSPLPFEVSPTSVSRLNACEITSQQCRPLPTGGTYQHSKYVPTPEPTPSFSFSVNTLHPREKSKGKVQLPRPLLHLVRLRLHHRRPF